jgi:hypothetical protein
MSGPTIANHNDSWTTMHAAYYEWTTVWMSESLSVLARQLFVGDTAGSIVVGWSPLLMAAYLHLAQEGVVGVGD